MTDRPASERSTADLSAIGRDGAGRDGAGRDRAGRGGTGGRLVVAGAVRVLRSPGVRWGFLVVALGLAGWYVLGNRDVLLRAAAGLSAGEVTLVVVLGVVYVWCTLLAWRAVLADLGSPLPLGRAVAVFGISQLGKYVPGGVWNVVAAAEVGAGNGVPRSRSATSMLVAVAVSVASGAAVGAVALPFVSAGALGAWSWVVWAAPAAVVVLAPPVLNRLIGLAVRAAGRGAPEHPMTWGGLGRAAGWSVAGFGISQLGKYVPGGVWNVVAAAEVGAGNGVPRSRSAASMLVAVAVSVASGAAVGAVALPFVSAGALGAWSWVVWAAPAVVVVLAPPVLNRLIGLAVRAAGRGAPEHPMTWGGLGRAAGWSVAGWLVAGSQLWVLCAGLGMPPSARAFALVTGGWALAWTAGFLFVLAPAGAGVREVVLAAVLAGALSGPAAGLAVLVSRVVLTLVDLGFAGAGLLLARGARQAAVSPP